MIVVKGVVLLFPTTEPPFFQVQDDTTGKKRLVTLAKLIIKQPSDDITFYFSSMTDKQNIEYNTFIIFEMPMFLEHPMQPIYIKSEMI